MSEVAGSHIENVARSYLGKTEIPLGSNSGPFVEACQRDTFLNGTGWPWCAAFVCHVAAVSGVRLAYASAGAHELADHYVAQRKTAHQALPGDVVDYNLGTGHTGILVHIDLASGTVQSVDGNWGNRVQLVIHRLSEVRCFWRMPGDEGKTPPLPWWTIATSAHGHSKILFRSRQKRKITRWLMHHTILRVAPNGITIRRPKRGS